MPFQACKIKDSLANLVNCELTVSYHLCVPGTKVETQETMPKVFVLLKEAVLEVQSNCLSEGALGVLLEVGQMQHLS